MQQNEPVQGVSEPHIRTPLEVEFLREKVRMLEEMLSDMRGQRDEWREQAKLALLAAPSPSSRIGSEGDVGGAKVSVRPWLWWALGSVMTAVVIALIFNGAEKILL